MKLMEDVILKHSIEIRTTPEKIFEFFYSLKDDKSYRAWHPDDHVALLWLKGLPCLSKSWRDVSRKHHDSINRT